MYVLKGSSNPSFYIGYSSDLKRRVDEHNSRMSSATRRGIPWKVVYYETFSNKKCAMNRELKPKQRGRA